MARKSDSEMIGYHKGTLTVIAFDSLRNNRSYWKVQCDCGVVKTMRVDGMHDYSTCDKCKAEKQRQRMLTHGETKTSLYSTWRGIKARCYKPRSNSYENYGGRGIKMFEAWKNSYETFRDYVPSNIRWADTETQANNKRVNHLLELDGEILNAKQWSNRLGIKYSTIMNRIRMGWSDKDVLTRPVEKHIRAV